MTALHLSRQDARLAALFAVGLPARLERTGRPPVVTRGELQSHWSRYLAKLVRPDAWLRLLSLKSDYRLMWRAITERARKSSASTAKRDVPPAPDLNPHFAPAMLELLHSGRTALILFGEQDPRRWDFEEKFLDPWSSKLAPYQGQITYSVIPAGNHILGTPAAVAEANRRTAAWLEALAARQVLVQPPETTPGMLRSGGGEAAIGIHRAALECVVKPMQAPAHRELPPCSANEYSTLIRPPK